MARRKGQSLTRRDVINAAISCIDAEGEASLGVNRVARQLGIKPPSLYNHVEGNDDLRRAVALEGWIKVLESHRGTRAHPDHDHAQRLRAVCVGFRQFAHERPALFAVTIATRLEAEDAAVAPVFDELFQLLSEDLSALGVAADALLSAAYMVRATLQGFIAMEQTDQIPDPAVAEQAFQWVVDNLVAGLARGR